MDEKEPTDVEFEETLSPHQSPVPGKTTEILATVPKMDFYEAVKAMMQEKKVTRLSWKDEEYWGELKDAVLKLHKPSGKYYDWIINDGDIEGDDWIII